MRTRLILPIAALLACTSFAPSPASADAPVRLDPVALDSRDPGRDRVGSLRFLDGWVLRSDAAGFGGFSALAVDGDRLTLLSDSGRIARFRLRRARAVEPSIAPLPGSAGLRAVERDTESLAVDRAAGLLWVGLETVNRICRYPADLASRPRCVEPPGMAGWPLNGGAEAMVRLRDGRFLVLSEQSGPADDAHDALLFDGDPVEAPEAAVQFRYRPPAGFVATDAAELPDGRIAVLNRRFTVLDGVAAAVTVIDPRAIAADATVEGREIARIAPPLTVDNMEGLAVTRSGGRTILWMLSDDNYLALQRTLLLRFVIEERRR